MRIIKSGGNSVKAVDAIELVNRWLNSPKPLPDAPETPAQKALHRIVDEFAANYRDDCHDRH